MRATCSSLTRSACNTCARRRRLGDKIETRPAGHLHAFAWACSSLPPARSGAALVGARASKCYRTVCPCFRLQGRVARGCDFGHVRLARSLRGLSDAFEKPALPRVPAPRPRRPQNKEAVPGRLYFARQPEQTPSAERPENKEPVFGRLCFTRNEAASPAQSTDVLIGIAGWRRLLGLRSRPRAGGYCIVLQAHLSARRGRAPLQTENRGFCRGISLSDAFDIPYRDVFDRSFAQD